MPGGAYSGFPGAKMPLAANSCSRVDEPHSINHQRGTMRLIPKKTAAQPTTTGMRTAFRSNQTAEANQIAIGASRTTSQRQGNCSSRNSGSAFQIGCETGK